MNNMFIEKLENKDTEWLNNFCDEIEYNKNYATSEIKYNKNYATISEIEVTYDSMIKIAKKMQLFQIKWVESKHAYKVNNPWMDGIHELILRYVVKGGVR